MPTPSDTPPLRDRLIAAGITTYEADVRFAYRYLIDRGIRGAAVGDPGLCSIQNVTVAFFYGLGLQGRGI